MLAVSVIALLMVLLILGVPVAFSLAIAGSVGLFLFGGFDSVFNILSTTPYRSVAHFSLTTIPMFILMAEFASSGKLARPLFTMMTRLLGHRRGGVAVAVVGTSAGFGAVCGSSIAAAGAISRIAVPEMLRAGYQPRVAAGIVSVAGTLAIMIPPSVPLVIYGIATETSIGKLLIAGLLPGLLTATIYAFGIIGWSFCSPSSLPTIPRVSWRERFASMREVWPFILLVLLVVVALYGGIATPTEIAALGALGALIITWLNGSMTLSGVLAALEHTVLATLMIFTIIMSAMIFGYFLTLTQTSQNLILLISESQLSPWHIMAALIVMYILMGCFLDQIAVLLITLPLTFPLVTSLGYDAIWFGIIVVKLVEIGLVTPPLGLNAYVVSSQTKIPLPEVFKGIGVMLIFDFITLGLLLAFPIIALFLPSFM